LSILAARSADLALAAEAEEHIGRALLLDEDNALALFNMICLRHHVLDEDFHKEYTQLCRLLDSGEPSSLADFDGGIFYYPNLSGGKQFDLMRNEMSGAFLSSLSKGSMYFERIASIVRWRVESMRAERLRQERRHMEALAAMERAAGGSVVDPSLEYGIAVHGGVLGEMEKALRYCDRAVAHNPLAMEPCSQKIDLLCALGRYEEALSFCRGILTMADAFDDSYYLGWRERFRSLRSEIESRISAEHALT
jgi:tetratricopeptide (TPR) repeat protein